MTASTNSAATHVARCAVVGEGFESTSDIRINEYTKKVPTMKTYQLH
jgi:hypothetical protein